VEDSRKNEEKAMSRSNHSRRTAYILARDGHLCQYCQGESGDTALGKHHLRAKDDIGTYSMTNLVAVCDACQQKIDSGYAELYGISTEHLCIPNLNQGDVQQVKQSVRELLQGEIREIITNAAQSARQSAGGALYNGRVFKSRNVIEKALRQGLTRLIPWSLVFEQERLRTMNSEQGYWLLSDIMNRRYTWIVNPLDRKGSFKCSGKNSFCVSVMLLDSLSPLASFAYYPEHESGGAEGALVETSGEESPLSVYLSLLKTRLGEYYPLDACGRRRVAVEKCLVLGEAGQLAGGGRYYVIVCLETNECSGLHHAMKNKLEQIKNILPSIAGGSMARAADLRQFSELKEEALAAVAEQNIRISYIAVDKACMEKDLADSEEALHDYFLWLLLDAVVGKGRGEEKIDVIFGSKLNKHGCGGQGLDIERLKRLNLSAEFKDTSHGGAFIAQAADYAADAIYAHYADGEGGVLQRIENKIKFALTFPRQKSEPQNQNLFSDAYMKEIHIFVDESGEFSISPARSPFFLFTMVFHDTSHDMKASFLRFSEAMKKRGYADNPFHAGPLINRHDWYSGCTREARREIFDIFFDFVCSAPIKYH
jgi:hypothetical protein